MKIEHLDSEFYRGFGVEIEVGPEVDKKEIGLSLMNFEGCDEHSRMVHIEDGPKGWADSRNNNYWHVKYDSSCGPLGHKIDHGWEIASFVGRTNSDLRHISDGARVIRDIGCKVNNNCGLHFHVGAEDFTEEKVSIMMARWLKFEAMLIQSCPLSRKMNKWCRPLRSKLPKQKMTELLPIDRPDRFWYWMKPKNLSVHENYDKRVTLNVINFARSILNEENDRSTVELRLPECILEPDHVYHWGLFFMNFVESCWDSKYPDNLDSAKTVDEALIYMGLSAPEGEFLILDGPLHETKLWLLNRLARHATLKKYAKRATELAEYISRF